MSDINLAPQLVECIPNFSEGRNSETIKAIEESISKVPDVTLLHTDIGYDANRTVMTMVGSPEAILDASFNAISTASKLINMAVQKGIHPRLGAVDVCPLVPISGVTMLETIELSKRLANRVGEKTTNSSLPL